MCGGRAPLRLEGSPIFFAIGRDPDNQNKRTFGILEILACNWLGALYT